jgi:hypothetical protein
VKKIAQKSLLDEMGFIQKDRFFTLLIEAEVKKGKKEEVENCSVTGSKK